MPTRITVAVVGPGDAAADDLAVAHDVGRLLAARGAVVLTGGHGGVMGAAARGARGAGGMSIGLLSGDSREDGDDAHSVLLPTGLGELRNGLLVRSADAVIAVGGSWGTLSEIALAMRTGVPVVAIGGWAIMDHHGVEVDVPRATTATEAIAAIATAFPS